MADPIISGGIRAQVVLQGVGDEPEDVFVNTWAFATASMTPVTDTNLDDVATALDAFYTALDSRFGKQVTGIYAKVYNLGTPPPRPPVEYDLLNPRATSAASLPSEVACCLSFSSGLPLPRQRGRVYIGPLTQACIDSTTPTPRIISGLRSDLVTAAIALANLTSSVRWCVLSQADAVLLQVDRGWIDDAFDIQRRRGEDATLRSEWAA